MSTLLDSTWEQRVLDFATALTARVGARLLQDSQGLRSFERKGDGSLVTASDLWADEQIRRAIAQEFPDHGILTEENTQVYPECEWCWVVDPLDGTTNFARGIPLWGISIGLLHWGMPVFGYLSFPPVQQTCYGWLGANPRAFLNQEPIGPDLSTPTKDHFFSFCTRSLNVLGKFFPYKIRSLGASSYHLLSVATGSVIGAVEATPKVWDLAAVWVIAKSTGIVWIDLDEPPFPLQTGTDYAQRSYPTLLIAQAGLRGSIRDWIPALQGGQDL